MVNPPINLLFDAKVENAPTRQFLFNASPTPIFLNSKEVVWHLFGKGLRIYYDTII